MIAYHRFVVAASLCSFLRYFLFVAFEGAQPAAQRKYGIINKQAHRLSHTCWMLIQQHSKTGMWRAIVDVRFLLNPMNWVTRLKAPFCCWTSFKASRAPFSFSIPCDLLIPFPCDPLSIPPGSVAGVQPAQLYSDCKLFLPIVHQGSTKVLHPLDKAILKYYVH